jgi:hypothetical protein
MSFLGLRCTLAADGVSRACSVNASTVFDARMNAAGTQPNSGGWLSRAGAWLHTWR